MCTARYRVLPLSNTSSALSLWVYEISCKRGDCRILYPQMPPFLCGKEVKVSKIISLENEGIGLSKLNIDCHWYMYTVMLSEIYRQCLEQLSTSAFRLVFCFLSKLW